jgi:diaminopimelate epimerase
LNIDLVWANPSGNITLLVTTPVHISNRPEFAQRLMQDKNLRAEQIGFITKPIFGGEGRLEMAGGEFCGNALRCYGLLLAKQRGRGGLMSVEMSGHSGIVAVETDIHNQTAWQTCLFQPTSNRLNLVIPRAALYIWRDYSPRYF